MTAAPISPPTSAWDELEGRPNHKVKRFHAIAAMSAAITTEIWISSLFNKSLPMVVATATPKRNGPMNSAMAAIVSAFRPEQRSEAITVATTLAQSRTPHRKAKTSARPMSRRSAKGESDIRRTLIERDRVCLTTRCCIEYTRFGDLLQNGNYYSEQREDLHQGYRSCGGRLALHSVRALSDNPLIRSEDQRRRIHRLALEMGYSPDAGAAQPGTRSHLHRRRRCDHNRRSFFGRGSQGDRGHGYSHGYSVILAASQDEPEREFAAVEMLRSKRVDAVIVTSSRVGRAASGTAGRGPRAGDPARRPQPGGALHTFSVRVDDEHGARLATEHLLALGHRSIAHVAGPAATVPAPIV